MSFDFFIMEELYMKFFITLKEYIYIFLSLNAIILIFLLLFTSFLPIKTIGFSLMSLSATFFLLFLVTINYQKYNNKVIIKQSILNNFSKTKLKVNLFLKNFYFGILFVIVWLG